MSLRKFEACSRHVWYPILEDLAVPCKILQLPEDFVRYLKADSIIISNGSRQALLNLESLADLPFCVDFEVRLREEISNLGGKVFVKLNWSSPKDASNMSARGLECYVPSDVYLLLKSSGRVARDIYKPFDREDLKGLVPLHLVIQKFYHFEQSREFRVFVSNGGVKCISQRHLGTFHSYLQSDSMRSSIVQKICDFVSDKVFASRGFSELDIVFDIYFDRDWSCNIKIIDLSPFYSDTDPLLFSWDEILSDVGGPGPELRLVDSEENIILCRNITADYPIELIRWMASKESSESTSYDGIFHGIRFRDDDDFEDDDTENGELAKNHDDFACFPNKLR